MLDRQDLRDAWQYVMLIAPAPIGALIGMRYAIDQTPKARAVTWLCSCGLGVIGAGVVGSRFGLGANEIALATVVCAAVGMEIMAGLITAARGFAANPFGFLGQVLDLAARILKRGQP